MKNQIEIVKNIADGMNGIGGIPNNEEFYAEFDMRVKAALGIAPVSGWHFLPEMPEVNKEVLVAIKYDNEPVQAYWTGKEWKGSFLVRDNMADGYVGDESFKHVQEWIYAWIELPQVPPIPEPF